MKPRALASMLVATLAAGCLSAPAPAEDLAQGITPPTGRALADAVRALVGELPCEAEVGSDTSANLAEVASDPLDLNGAVGTGELWLQGDRAYVARYGTGGFSVVDIADPLHPVELASWDPDDGSGDRALDVKATPDGTALLVGGDSGIRILDVRDPHNITLEHRLELSTQAHMLTVFTVQGADYVAAAKGDGGDLPIWRIVGGPGNHTLEPVSSVAVTPFTQLTGLWGPHDLLRTHDAFFFDDPLLHKPTLWVADTWWGVAAFDVSDPASPRQIARILPSKPQYAHTVQTFLAPEGIAQGHRITVSVAEVGVNSMRVFDTTDLANPVPLAEWSVTNPTQPQHNLQVVWPYLYVAHYLEGVFVFDLAAIVDGAAPEPIARLASGGGNRPPAGPTSVLGALGLFGGTWDVGLRDGLVYATDGGLRIAAFGCVPVGDPGMKSVG